MCEEQDESATRASQPCQSVDACLRRPIVIGVLTLVSIILFVAGVWIFAGRFLQQFENISRVYEYFKERDNERMPSQPQNGKSATKGVLDLIFPSMVDAADTESSQTSLVTSQIDGHYTVARENGYVSLKKMCETCAKIVFNTSQLEEIVDFLRPCFDKGQCDTQNYTTSRGYCLVCDPMVHMALSPLNVCLDFNGYVNSAFIGSYVLYANVLVLFLKFIPA